MRGNGKGGKRQASADAIGVHHGFTLPRTVAVLLPQGRMPFGPKQEAAVSQITSPIDQLTAPDTHAWVQYLPDGAISVDIEEATLVLHASHSLQERFETLLAKRKAGMLSPEDQHEYAAICALDTALSWLNRLARGARTS